MASQITSLTIVVSTVYSGADHRKHQSSASLAFVRGIHRWPVNSPHKGPVTWKMFPFDDVIMIVALSPGPQCINNWWNTTSVCVIAGQGPSAVQDHEIEVSVNSLRPRQNGRHFTDNIFKCIFLNENLRISLKIWLKFVPWIQINNIPALVQIMAWRRSGDKPLSEPTMVSLLAHICVTRPQWVNSLRSGHCVNDGLCFQV